MYLHEHDAKQLLARYGVPIPDGCITDAAMPADLPQPGPWIVKGQISAGGRGKAGIIKKASTRAELDAHARAILGKTVKGRCVERVRIERSRGRGRAYIGLLLDAEACGVRVIVSARGGMEIESVPPADVRSEVARLEPSRSLDCAARLALGFEPKAARPCAKRAPNWRMLSWPRSAADRDQPAVRSRRRQLGRRRRQGGDRRNAPRAPARVARAGESRRGGYPEAAVKLEHGFDYVVVDPDGEIGLLTTGAGLSMMLIDELRARPEALQLSRCAHRRPARRYDAARQRAELDRRRRSRACCSINIFAGITELGEFSRLLVDAMEKCPH